jgi:hypothetical protein
LLAVNGEIHCKYIVTVFICSVYNCTGPTTSIVKKGYVLHSPQIIFCIISLTVRFVRLESPAKELDVLPVIKVTRSL